MGAKMIYRRDIDGLRTLAVVPVILFHAGFTLFSGGYVGVDVFFVISGYLITSILISELEQGDFSIARFYERRARRILPALFFVMLCCIPFACMWMLPSELNDFSQSIVAVIFFSSNILFWREEGYFAPSADLKPLLHTWSLAVEEQYYVLFPIFLLLAWKAGRNRVFWSVCGVALISLFASEWGWRNNASANFYLAPTRAWELLAGSICAFLLYGRRQISSNFLSFVGLLLIGFSVFYFDDSTPFPSIYALAPVLGAVLIILFGADDTWTSKLLSLRGFVGIGLISYSAYLWHQPLFAFARVRSTTEPSPYLMSGLAALTLVLAYFSWRYIERPFRKGKHSVLLTRRSVFLYSASIAVLFVTAALFGVVTKGNPFNKYDDRNIRYYAKMQSMNETWKNKIALRLRPFPDNGKKNILVIGDSNSGDLLNAIMFAFKDRYNYSSATIEVRCGNLYLDRSSFVSDPGVKSESQCIKSDSYGKSSKLIKEADFVFIGSSWSAFEIKHFRISWDRLNLEFGPKFFVFGAKNTDFSERKVLETEFVDLNNLYFAPNEEKVGLNNEIRKVVGDRFIDPYDFLCRNNKCKLNELMSPIFYDGSHLTTYGTELMGSYLKSWGEVHLQEHEGTLVQVLKPSDERRR